MWGTMPFSLSTFPWLVKNAGLFRRFLHRYEIANRGSARMCLILSLGAILKPVRQNLIASGDQSSDRGLLGCIDSFSVAH